MQNARLVKHRLESSLLGEISINSDRQNTTLVAESEEELKSLLVKVKECREPPGCAQTVTTSREERGACKAALPHMGLSRGPNVSPWEPPG